MLDRLKSFSDNLSLRKKGAAVVAIPLTLLLISVALFYQYEKESRSAAKLISHTLEVQSELHEFLTLVVDTQSGARGYRLTSDKSFLVPHYKAVQQLPDSLNLLDKLVADNPAQGARVRELRQISEQTQVLRQQIIAAAFDSDTAKESVLAMMRQTKHLTDRVRATVADMLEEENRLLDERSTASDILYNRIKATIAAFVVLALLAGYIVNVFYSNGIAKRIERLHINAALLVDNQPLLPSPEGTDEVCQLGRAMSDMARILSEREQSLQEAKAEQELLNVELEKRLTEATTANKELEAFSYSVSHDLRAPLRHVAGFSDLLVRNSEAMDAKSLRYVGIISKSIQQMGTLIDDLLSFSRMGRSAMSTSDVNLNQLLEEVRNDLQHEEDTRDIEWKISPLPSVHGDAPMLRLVMQNFVGNAVKYTRGRNPAIINISGETNPDSGEVTVKIQDNGAGFDMQYLDKLFGVFQRLHRSEEFEGTGIGLATARRIVYRHGGSVSASGKLGEGATFSFMLPKYIETETS